MNEVDAKAKSFAQRFKSNPFFKRLTDRQILEAFIELVSDGMMPVEQAEKSMEYLGIDLDKSFV
jgi:hypothetical protein